MAANEQLRVDIGPAAGGSLEITRHEVIDPSGAVRPPVIPLAEPFVELRLYPAVWASPLRASVGSVAQQGVRAEQIIDETVAFDGTDTARTAKRVSSGLSIQVAGRAFDVDGQPVSVSVTGDATGQLRASRPFYGEALVSYTSEYRLLRYSYGITALPGGGARITAGSVFAWWDGQVARYDVPPLELGESDPDLAVLFRDVSYTILQQSEEYERPPGWPDATWPGNEPDPDSDWVENERTHTIGYIDKACRISTRDFPHVAAKPHVNSNNYEIPVVRIMTSAEQLEDRGFSSACIARANQQLQEF